MSRKRFKIKYPQDHEKAGEDYKAPDGHMIMVNSRGVFFIADMGNYYTNIKLLSSVLHKYDVEWL